MLVEHKYLKYDWNNGFATNHAVLDTTPYDPEVIFIGTFNPDWEWNHADFFYGRGMYMWPILANLFVYNRNEILSPRSANINPSLKYVFDICEKAKITFADIIKGTNETAVLERIGKAFTVNNVYHWNSYKDSQLCHMGDRGWLDDNVDAIVNYINRTKSIKYVYFTFKSGTWLVKRMERIKKSINVEEKKSIFTPTGNGFGRVLAEFPNKATSIVHSWIWNGLEHPIPINRPGNSVLNHNWLIENGVDISNF